MNFFTVRPPPGKSSGIPEINNVLRSFSHSFSPSCESDFATKSLLRADRFRNYRYYNHVTSNLRFGFRLYFFLRFFLPTSSLALAMPGVGGGAAGLSATILTCVCLHMKIAAIATPAKPSRCQGRIILLLGCSCCGFIVKFG